MVEGRAAVQRNLGRGEVPGEEQNQKTPGPRTGEMEGGQTVARYLRRRGCSWPAAAPWAARNRVEEVGRKEQHTRRRLCVKEGDEREDHIRRQPGVKAVAPAVARSSGKAEGLWAVQSRASGLECCCIDVPWAAVQTEAQNLAAACLLSRAALTRWRAGAAIPVQAWEGDRRSDLSW